MVFKWVFSLTSMITGTTTATMKDAGSNQDLEGLKTPEIRRENEVFFQMPVHYPRYSKDEYEKMEDWKVERLLQQYGIGGFKGSLEEKRAFAMGAFLWPN